MKPPESHDVKKNSLEIEIYLRLAAVFNSLRESVRGKGIFMAAAGSPNEHLRQNYRLANVLACRKVEKPLPLHYPYFSFLWHTARVVDGSPTPARLMAHYCQIVPPPSTNNQEGGNIEKSTQNRGSRPSSNVEFNFQGGELPNFRVTK